MFGYNYLDIGMRTVNFTRWHDKYEEMPIFGGETSSAVRSRGTYMLPDTSVFSTTGNMRYQCSGYDNHLQSSGNGIYTKTAEDAHKTVRDYTFDMGEFVWTGFDYFGEPSPYGGNTGNANAKNSYFGIVDTAGLPKDIYYFYQSVWTDEPVLHILPYWAPVSTVSFNGIESPAGLPIWVYSNAPSVELFLNGESLGRQDLDLLNDDTLHYRWVVPYEDGVVKAVGYDEDGKEIACSQIETFGDPAKIQMEADRNKIYADGKDLIFIETSIHDKDGVFVANANNYVEFKVEGAGTLVAVDNGNSNDLDAFASPARRVFAGKAVAIVKSDGTGGEIKITASSHGLESETITVTAQHNQAVTGVNLTTIDGTTAITTSGGTLKTTAKVMPETADYEKVAYTVTETDGTATDKAVINRSGVLTALKNGTVRVTATALDGSGQSDSIDITISGQNATTPVTGITVKAEAENVTIKSRVTTMTAEVTPSNATISNVIWSVTNKDPEEDRTLATINAAGVLTPLYDGVVTVRATAADGSGVYDEQEITISGQNPSIIPVTSISIELISDTRNLSATDNEATFKVNKWPANATTEVTVKVGTVANFDTTPSNATITEFDPESGIGKVQALDNGSFAVVATATNGWTNTTSPVRNTLTFTSTGFTAPENLRDPYDLILASSFDDQSGTSYIGPEDDQGVYFSGNRSYAIYEDIDFGPWGSKELIVHGFNGNVGQNSMEYEIHLDDPNGPHIGTIRFDWSGVAGWPSGTDPVDWVTQTFIPEPGVGWENLTGVQNLCFMATSGNLMMYGFEFTRNEGEDRDPYAVNLAEEADDTATGVTGYKGFVFGDEGSNRVVISGSSTSNVQIDIRDGSADGAFLSGVMFQNTGGETYGQVFDLSGIPIDRGHHIYFIYPEDFELESVRFLPTRPDPVSAYNRRFEAEDFDIADASIVVETYTDSEGELHQAIVGDDSNFGVTYHNLDFGTGGDMKMRVYGKGDGTREIRVATKIEGNIQLAIGSQENKDYAVWEFDINIPSETGVSDLTIGFLTGTDVWIDWFEFVMEPETPDTYTVTFETGGGTVIPAQTVEAGGTVTRPADPIREGYTFNGWYKDAELTQAWNFATDTVTEDITLYAGWSPIPVTPDTYTVRFDTGGGSAVDSVTVEAGGTIPEPAAPTRDGYVFEGWYTDATYTTLWNFATGRVTGDMTLYAGWRQLPGEETYTVTFDSRGGSAVASVTAEGGKTIAEPTAPTRRGYTFTGWYKDTACTDEWNFATDTVTGDTTLYAGWATEPGKTVTEDTWDDGTVVTTVEDEETGDKTVYVDGPDGTETVVDVPAEGEITAEIKLGEGVDETVVVIPLDDMDGGTVAIIVHEDGTEEIIKWSVADDGKLYIPVDGDVTVKIVQNGKSFTDEDDAVWAKDAIAFVTARELFLGTSDTEFAPNLAMSRGMLATVLYRLEGEPEVGENPFEDVEAGEYYEDPITWAEANGVVKGTGGNFFSPKNDITREELAVMLHRYAGEPEAEADMSHFPDADKISDWAEEAMTWALAEGIITGKDGNMAEPGANATRAEVATMLQRFILAG